LATKFLHPAFKCLNGGVRIVVRGKSFDGERITSNGYDRLKFGFGEAIAHLSILDPLRNAASTKSSAQTANFPVINSLHLRANAYASSETRK